MYLNIDTENKETSRHYMHIRIVKLRRFSIPTASKDVKKLKFSYTVGGNVK